MVEQEKITSSTGEEFKISEITHDRLHFRDFQENLVKGQLVGNLIVWNDGGIWCRDLFDKMDTNQDGVLLPEEVLAAFDDIVAITHSDGEVSQEQFELYCQ